MIKIIEIEVVFTVRHLRNKIDMSEPLRLKEVANPTINNSLMASGLAFLVAATGVTLSSSWSLPRSDYAPRVRRTGLQSTAMEADFYQPTRSSPALAVPPNTKLVVGLNKYSHDTSICAANARTGEILFALSKERLSRKKHDAGNTASLIECCLESLDLELENIVSVVMNNHHHRILPLEKSPSHMEWEAGLNINGGSEDGYTEPENLLPHAIRHELSHHLAHAYSTAAQAPFDTGLCVVMDGIGDTFRTMLEAEQTQDTTYTSDLSFVMDSFQCIPSDLVERQKSHQFDFREAESVYRFRKNETSFELWPVFKRFTPENTSPTRFNHGFENMDSVGAVYSRASSHIFGDWNVCGKVMGLAPWALHEWSKEDGSVAKAQLHSTPIMEGSLYAEEGEAKFRINRTLLEGLPIFCRNDPDLFDADGNKQDMYDFDDNDGSSQNDESSSARKLPSEAALASIALASRIQSDLETICIDFVSHMKDLFEEDNLCLAGGVALNSVLNGRLSRELGFKQTFISPYPGDDGISVGCCAFGVFGNSRIRPKDLTTKIKWVPQVPYFGPKYSELEIKSALSIASPWIEIETRKEDDICDLVSNKIASGRIVAWYRSRSEMGPRALGDRSILADPRKKDLVRFINQFVKGRESFRPFAPSVLAEEVVDWFEVDGFATANFSPFMSVTAMVKEAKRSEIPAVTHVDGSSRIQTVTQEESPLYHKLISRFFALTGVPMILNTSFNTLPNEPIVETPSDAIRSFLYSMGSIELLVLDDYVIRLKTPDVQSLLGEMTMKGELTREPSLPRRTGPAKVVASLDMAESPMTEEGAVPTTKVHMPDRPLHGPRNEWFEFIDELESEIFSVCDGKTSLNEIMRYFTQGIETIDDENMEDMENLLQNIVQRIVRLYEQTLISW